MVYIKSKTYNKTINITFYKVLNKTKPFIEYIKIISFIIYIFISKKIKINF